MADANLLFIHALTSVHPGGGAALGVVDLPVQRERHTQWPMIAGSGLKGTFRDACRRPMDGGEWLAAFGPETTNASDHAGALAFTDARLLAFPVRSLRGIFAWATCPAVLHRFGRDAKLLAGSTTAPPAPPPVERGQAACPSASDNLVDGRCLLLEEFEFLRTGDDSGIAAIAAWLAGRAIGDEETGARLKRNLVVLHDDDFTYFARHATEVVARVGLDYESKTVRKGALFYEEFLPPETLLYSVVLATASRRRSKTDRNGKESRARVDLDAARMLGLLRRHTPPTLQIGADQTIGKGLWCARQTGGG